jgi:hypothetical protein
LEAYYFLKILNNPLEAPEGIKYIAAAIKAKITAHVV